MTNASNQGRSDHDLANLEFSAEQMRTITQLQRERAALLRRTARYCTSLTNNSTAPADGFLVRMHS